MTQRQPWPVRTYRRAAWVLGDLSAEATETFAALYERERRRGRGAALWLWLRVMLDLGRGAIIVTPLNVFAAVEHDLRWAWRTTWARPGVSVVVIASIGLAIAANTAAFSVVNAFLWRPWGSGEADRIVRVREDYARPGQAPDVRGFTMAHFGAWQRANTVFEAMAAGMGSNATLIVDGRAERVSAGVVTANFFDVLGFPPVIGRTFTSDEDSPGRRDAVLLGDALWRSRFGADPGVLGRTVRLDGSLRTVVGVMPRGLKHPYQSDLWVPLGYRDDPTNRAGVYVPARLKRGVTIARATKELDAMAAAMWQERPSSDMPAGAQATLLRPEMLGRLSRVLYALAATALLVLLIAVANVSNLLLAQSLEQRTEAAVRTAIGASRIRLARQQLTYGMLLSGIGGLLGVLLTFWSVGPLVSLSPLHGAGEFDIEPRLDAPTLAFTIAITMAVGIAFGALPAIGMARTSVSDVLRSAGRSRTLSVGNRRWLNGLVVVELALAFVLLVGATVMGQGLLALHRDPWGFDRRDLMTFDIALPVQAYPDQERQQAFTRGLLEKIEALSGVSAAGATTSAPFFEGIETAAINIDGTSPPERGFFLAHVRTVTPRYFETMGMPLLAGRAFTTADSRSAVPVAIVSQSLAERHWPGQNPIGRRIKRGRLDAASPWIEVVGIVGNLRENPADNIPPGDAWYLPYSQPSAGSIGEMTYVVKTTAGAAILSVIRHAVSEHDPDVPIFDAVTMEERFARFTSTERLSVSLTATLAILGVFLAAVGVYAVLAFSVRRRRPELGIRVALGARPVDVRGLVLREAWVLIGVGLGLGAIISVFARPALDANLFGTNAGQPMALALAGIGVMVAALISAVVPATRAARIDPMQAMTDR